KRHFRELLQSDERISSNILADRLAALVENGLLTRSEDPTHKQKAIYSLTEKAIALLPVIVQIGERGSPLVPGARKLDTRARKVLREIQQGGPRAWAKRMDDLRAQHLRCRHRSEPTCGSSPTTSSTAAARRGTRGCGSADSSPTSCWPRSAVLRRPS